MRALIQRVAWAEVAVEGQVVGRTGPGLLVYIGAAPTDTLRDAQWLAEKVASLRIFEDENGKLNRSVRDARGGVLVVSNFTLLADAQKGRRPSFAGAASADQAEPLANAFTEALAGQGLGVETGRFGATMAVRSEAAGPVNILLDSPAAPGV
jgi:D-aminoacyl-tRNA deacylase